MSYVTWRIDQTPFENGVWSTEDTETLTSYHDIQLKVGLGDTKDTFEFKITNVNDSYDGVFNNNDKITIYRTSNSLTVDTDTDLLMIGTVKDLPDQVSSNNNFIRLSGYNFSEAITSAIVFVDPQNRTIPEILKQAVDNAGEKNQNFKVTWHPDNPIKKTDGTNFPTVSERWYNKTLKDLLNEYSTNESTKDGNYFWYVDKDNQLVWRKAATAQSYTFDYATDLVKEYKDSKDVSGVRNFIILKGGLDPANRQIQTRFVNWTSVSKHGMKYLFHISKTNTAKQLVSEDIGVDDTATISYPNITAAAFTTKWKAQHTYTTKNYSISVTENNYVTINEGDADDNKKAYTEVIRTEITKRLEKEGEDIATQLQFGKLNVDLTFPSGNKIWGLGDNIQCTIPKVSTEGNKILRVKEIHFTSDTDTYSLEEEIGSV